MSINNKYQPLYIASDNTITTVENISSNLQFCEVNNSINTISVPTIINQNIDEDLNLAAFDGSTINPIIKINNTHQHVNITSNLNIASNLNIENLTITHNSISTNVHPKEISFLDNTLRDIGHVSTKGFCYEASTGVTYVGFDSSTKNNRIPHEGGNFGTSFNRVFYGDVSYIDNIKRNMHTALKICHADAGKNGAGWHMGLPIEYANTGEHAPDADGGTNLFFAVQFKNGNIRYAGWLRSNNATGTLTPTEMNFTGQHRCVPNNINYYNNVDNFIGLIVYSTGDYKTYDTINDILYSDNNAITINNSLPIIELTNIKKEPAVFGIISNKEEENRNYCAGNFVTPISNLNDDKRLYINSLGEGAIWVVNTNGNLKNGDYIQSSDILGMGERQDDDILHNYTVAKITCNCNFDINSSKYKCESFIDSTSDNTYLKAFVGCTYHCG